MLQARVHTCTRYVFSPACAKLARHVSMRLDGILGSPVQSKLEKVLEKATRLNLKFFAKTVRRVRRKMSVH